MSDEVEMELLRRLRPPVPAPDPATVAEQRKVLMTHITQTPNRNAPPAPAPARPRRSRWLLPVVVLASAATAAAGWAAFRSDPETSTAVACGDSIITSSTGDPIADCAALWRRENGTEPPPLVAYVGPGGGVHVLPEGETPPDGSTALTGAFRQDAAIIELEAELADVSRGLKSRCFGEADARALVEGQLRRLGLTGWRIKARRADPPAPERCPVGTANFGTAGLDPGQKQVLLLPNLGGPPPSDLPFMRLARWLTGEFVDGPGAQCVTVEEAAARARQEAARLGLREAAGEVVFNVVSSEVPGGCARPTTVVGGTVQVTIRSSAGR